MNRRLYHQPLRWRILDYDFRVYTQEHILGYFGPGRSKIETREDQFIHQYPQRGSIQSEYSVAADSNITEISNRTANSEAMTGWSDMSRYSFRSAQYSWNRQSFLGGNLQRITAVYQASTFLKTFEGSHLKTFSSTLFMGDTMWICGWNTSKFFQQNVFLNVKVPEFHVLTKQKKIDKNAESPTIMFPFGDYILYAKKMGSEVFTFHTQSHTFKRRYSSDNLSIAAICGTNYRVFILNQNEPTFIAVLDANFQSEGKIATHLNNTEINECSFDICLIESHLSNMQARMTMDHTIVISSSSPNGSIRAVNQSQGLLWQLDSTSDKQLDTNFNPCSVSSSEDGVIFIADQREKCRMSFINHSMICRYSLFIRYLKNHCAYVYS